MEKQLAELPAIATAPVGERKAAEKTSNQHRGNAVTSDEGKLWQTHKVVDLSAQDSDAHAV